MSESPSQRRSIWVGSVSGGCPILKRGKPTGLPARREPPDGAPPRNPIGGTTGLDHSGCGAAIDAAVAWLRETQREARRGAAIPQLRERFGLSPAEACQAIASSIGPLEAPMSRRSKSSWLAGVAWVAHRLDLVQSPAWRLAPVPVAPHPRPARNRAHAARRQTER